MINNVISVWKPPNITSFDVLRYIKTIVKNKKIGHCGTLDPFAEGVLVVCFDEYTKEISTIMDEVKKYKAQIYLGAETDTLDVDGKIIRKNNSYDFNIKDILLKLRSFEGNIWQIPPYFSAKKIHGVRMYKLARNDIFIKRKPVLVTIQNIDLIKLENNILSINVTCSKGTYIRSLARDIAYSLNTYGYLKTLERFQLGPFNKENSIKFKDLKKCLN